MSDIPNRPTFVNQKCHACGSSQITKRNHREICLACGEQLGIDEPRVRTLKTHFWSHPNSPDFRIEYLDFFPQDPPIEIVAVWIHGVQVKDSAMWGLKKFAGFDLEELTESVANGIQRTNDCGL